MHAFRSLVLTLEVSSLTGKLYNSTLLWIPSTPLQTFLFSIEHPYASWLFSLLPFLRQQTRHEFNVGVVSGEFLGFLCNCVLPAELNQTKIRQVRSEESAREGEKKKLRSWSTRFISSSNPVNTSPSLTSYPSSSESRSGRQKRSIPVSPRSFVHDESSSSTWSLKA